jgi:hypothetical protein
MTRTSRIVRFGFIHDRCGRSHASMSVRFCPKADKRADVLERPLCAKTGLMRCSKDTGCNTSLDQLVGVRESP